MSWNEDIRLLNKEVSTLSLGLKYIREVFETLRVRVFNIKTYGGSTGDSLAVNAGPITITTQDYLAYVPGQTIRLTHNSANYMQGRITGYIGDQMSITIDYKVGSGTYHTWILSPAIDIVPAGGNTGEVLKKVSNTDFDTAWTPASGGGITSIVQPGNTNFALADGVGYEIPSNTFTANRTCDVSALTKESEVYNGDQSYSLLFTGAPVYADGGANVVTEAPAMRTCRFRKVGSKVFILN